MAKGKFVTAINCMDGRVQAPVIQWLRHHCHADFVDMITEAGPARVLTVGLPWSVNSIRERAEISVKAHGSRLIAVIAHDDCAGHPVPKEKQLSDLRKCLELVASWSLPVRVITLWVDDNWQVELIDDSQA